MSKQYNNSDILFIFKEDNIETHKQIRQDLYWFREDDDKIDLNWDDTLVFNNEEPHILYNFKHKMRYLFASIHEDTRNKEIICSIVPELNGPDSISLSPERVVKADNLSQWMKKYKFTEEEFLTNSKYVVVSDTWYDEVDKLFDLGLIDWDKIAFCSAFPDYNGFKDN